MARPMWQLATPVFAVGMVILLSSLVYAFDQASLNPGPQVPIPPCPLANLSEGTHQYVPDRGGASPAGWYNFTVGCDTIGVQWSGVELGVETARGYSQASLSNTSVQVLTAALLPIASFTPSGYYWNTTSRAAAISGQQISVFTTYSLDGGTLWARTCYSNGKCPTIGLEVLN